MRRLAIIALLVIASAAVADLHVARQSYTPVIRVASPDGLTYTALFEPRPDWYACAEASRRFLDPVKERCAACEVVFARCERSSDDLEAMWGAEQQWVAGPGINIAISGPTAAARRSCHFIAVDVMRRGAGAASCLHRRTGAPSS